MFVSRHVHHLKLEPGVARGPLFLSTYGWFPKPPLTRPFVNSIHFERFLIEYPDQFWT